MRCIFAYLPMCVFCTICPLALNILIYPPIIYIEVEYEKIDPKEIIWVSANDYM